MDYLKLLDDCKPLQIFRRDKEAGMISHAYAVFGDDSEACKGITYLMARAAVCPDGGCGVCQACSLIAEGGNPDVKTYEGNMPVSRVEELIEDSGRYAVSGNRKIYVIDNLEDMSSAAQNKLLKTVEEPSEGVTFIFGITKPAAVAETLKSRCKKLYYTGIGEDKLHDALVAEYGDTPEIARVAECACGNIERAVRLAEDPSFAADTDMMVSLLTAMKKSSQVIGEQRSLVSDKEHIARYLDITEMIIDMIEKYKRGLHRGGGGISLLAQDFSQAALACTQYLVNDCRRMLESNCAPAAVADTLLFGILEVKYKCR